MIRLKWVAVGLVVSAFSCESAFAQIVPDDWSGNSGASSHIDDPANWTGGIIPGASSIMYYSPDFAVGPSANLMTMNVAGSVSGIDVESSSTLVKSGNISIVGAGTLSLGASGIAMNQTFNLASSVAGISAPLLLQVSQTWAIRNSNFQATGAVSEQSPGTALTISNTGGTLVNVELDSPNSTFSGGTTVTGGAGTVFVVGSSSLGPAGAPTSGPVGTGTLTLGNGVSLLTPATKNYTIGNNIAIGTGGGPSTVNIDGGFGGSIILTGTISDGGGFPGT